MGHYQKRCTAQEDMSPIQGFILGLHLGLHLSMERDVVLMVETQKDVTLKIKSLEDVVAIQLAGVVEDMLEEDQLWISIKKDFLVNRPPPPGWLESLLRWLGTLTPTTEEDTPTDCVKSTMERFGKSQRNASRMDI